LPYRRPTCPTASSIGTYCPDRLGQPHLARAALQLSGNGATQDLNGFFQMAGPLPRVKNMGFANLSRLITRWVIPHLMIRRCLHPPRSPLLSTPPPLVSHAPPQAIPCAWILLYCHRHRNWREICSEQLTLSLAGVGGAGGFMWVLLICLRHDGTITWPWFYCTLPLIVMTVAGIAYLLGIIVPLRNDRCTPCGMAIMATPLLPFEVIYALRLDGTLTCSWWLVFIPVFVELGILNVCALLGVIGMSCNADPDQGNRQATCDLFWREVASHIGATPRQIDWLRSQQKKKRTSRCRPPRDDRACKDDAEEKRPASGEGHGAAGGTDQASDTDDNSTISGPDNDNNEDRATKADYVGLHRAHRKADAQDGEDAGAPDALGDVGDTPPELGPEEPTLDAPVAVAVAAAVPAPATDAAAPAIAPPPLQLR